MRDLARLRVLLVEDNTLDARTMERLLASNPDTTFETRHVQDLATAIELLDKEPFDCVLLDLSLPDSHGLLAIDTIATKAPHAPIVVLTGLDDPTTAVESLDRGAHDFLPKGRVDGEIVARSIRYAVARNHADVTLLDTTKKLEIARDRGRIARDLHDTVVQQLFATGMGLQAISKTTADVSVKDGLSAAIDQIDTGIRQLRAAIFDLNIEGGDHDEQHELDASIKSQASGLGFTPTLTKRNVEDLSPDLLREILAIVREALSNVVRHAHATSAEVSLVVGSDWLTLEIIDNGRGVTESRLNAAPEELTGHGLKNMARRAADLGGTFAVRPGPGGGTRIVWRVPNRPRVA